MPPTYFFEKKSFNRFRNKIKQYPWIALFLDFDGTLVPIQKDPAQCFLSGRIKKQLKLIADSTHFYIIILSGRSLSDIKKRVGIKKIYYGGNHGLDISGSGMRYTHPEAQKTKSIINAIERRLKKEIAKIKGAWLENKKYSLSLHFRSVTATDIPLIKKIFRNTVDEFLKKNLLSVIKGKKVLELVPAVSWDKGKAVFLILQRLKHKCLPIYIGDDQTDETAFRALNKKGITIRVGKSAKTDASYYLKSQREVSEFLKKVSETRLCEKEFIV